MSLAVSDSFPVAVRGQPSAQPLRSASVYKPFFLERSVGVVEPEDVVAPDVEHPQAPAIVPEMPTGVVPRSGSRTLPSSRPRYRSGRGYSAAGTSIVGAMASSSGIVIQHVVAIIVGDLEPLFGRCSSSLLRMRSRMYFFVRRRGMCGSRTGRTLRAGSAVASSQPFDVQPVDRRDRFRNSCTSDCRGIGQAKTMKQDSSATIE